MTKAKQPNHPWYRQSAKLIRWLHIYLSMVAFGALLFFSFTGLTLNHPTWLGATEQQVRDAVGKVPMESLGEQLDQLAIAEHLRAEQDLHGRVSEFVTDEHECMIVFKSPGYSADIFVDRGTGAYRLSETSTNWVSIMNDLHKGRDSGTRWSLLIDISAVLLILVAISGLALLFYLKRRRVFGTIVALVGTLAILLAFLLAVP
jgi:hypothetical protein